MSGIEAAFFGSLVDDAEQKTSQNGRQYLRSRVRVGDGEGAQWVRVTAFDPEAIEASDKFVKGARVYVEGRLTADTWTAKDGTTKHGLSVLSWHCRLAAIGRNKPQRKGDSAKRSRAATSAPAGVGAFDDPLTF